MYPASFNPIMLETIAFVCTGVSMFSLLWLVSFLLTLWDQIHSVLCDYEAGVNNSAKSDFSAVVFGPVYLAHLATLREFQLRATVAVASLQRDTFTEAQ